MSNLLIIDSFDHYASAQGTRKWTLFSGSVVAGRNGNGFQEGSFTKTFATGHAQVIQGMAINPDSFLLTNGGNVFRAYNSAVQVSSMGVESFGDGRFRYFYNGGHVIIPYVFNAGQWYYIESSMQLSVVSGNLILTYEFHVNGAVIISGTATVSVFSDFIADPFFHSIQFSAVNLTIVDDVYCTDTEFLGDIDIVCLFPRAEGSVDQWVPVGASPNFACVKEHIPDDDTTYVQCASTNIGNKDQYFLDQILGFTGTIKGGQFLWCVKKSDAGVGSITASLKNGTTELAATFIDAATTFFPSDASYIYAIAPYRKSPFSGSDWTPTEVNATQQGHTRSS